MKWQTVIGFEIHVELGTDSKMFCGCPADHFGKSPNTQTCPVCLGLPGALPVPNTKAIEWCIKLGLALNCKINLTSKFDRKNYFYPDLPKGYQISQYDQPFCYQGAVTLSSGKIIRITRVHMEEDTAKLQHAVLPSPEIRRGEGEVLSKVSLIDFNRSGVPLVEIVTEPDFDNTNDVTEYLKEIQLVVRTLGISTADMEKGSMRLEANISVRPVGQKELPKYKIEVKNVNSFRFIKKAIDFEVDRQIRLLETGVTPVQETRGFKESNGETFSQRLKEEANEYRYFPEPDIPPLVFTQKVIDKWQSELPELPDQKRAGLMKAGLTADKAGLLVSDFVKYQMYTKLVQTGLQSIKAADIIINAPGDILTDLDKLIAWSKEKEVTMVGAGVIEAAVKTVIAAHPNAIVDYKSGKVAALFFLIGQVKKQLGNVDIGLVREAIVRQLNS
jgi:aspartyl-tRNA(Asn)/glutamyl-tRNA(Gln) amidotransferase subunit B